MTDVTRTVGNLMVKTPISVECWQPVAHARQLMLMHSFSFLPVRLQDNWWLLSELAMAKYLNTSGNNKRIRLGRSLEEAVPELELIKVSSEELLSTTDSVDRVLCGALVKDGPALWLVVERERPEHLAGVLSPFELM